MLEFFDFYGLNIFFCLDSDTKFRTKYGFVLTVVNFVLLLIFVSTEFSIREDKHHKWQVPAWQFDIKQNPSMVKT